MKAIITPGRLAGKVVAVPSKSYAHRYLICAALSHEKTTIRNYGHGDDIIATLNVLSELGATYIIDGNDITITPIWDNLKDDNAVFRCHESGTTLRMILPIAAALVKKAQFTGSGRLPMRPLSDLENVLNKNGKEIFLPEIKDSKIKREIGRSDSLIDTSKNGLPECEIVSFSGELQSGVYEIPGNVSSQYVSGLLMALPLLSGGSEIRLTTDLESVQYVEMTRQVLYKFGIKTEVSYDNFITYHIPGSQRYESPLDVEVPGDWSNGAVFFAASALHYSSYGDRMDAGLSRIDVEGLEKDFLQGDSQIESILPEFFNGGQHRTVDIKNIPDLLPILSVVAGGTVGRTVFVNGRRLRFKESDRIHAAAELVKSLGGKAEETEGGLIITGTGYKGGVVDSFHDHRIVMAAAIAGSIAKEEVTILHAEAVNKSYPGFFDDFIGLGGKATFAED